MYIKNNLIKLVVAAFTLFPIAVCAQPSSINAFSPYTMYGIGEINTPGSVASRSMGGAGVALRTVGSMNLMNPASYSVAPQKSFLFNVGLEGQNHYNRQTVGDQQKKTSYNSFNIHDVALRFPLAKKLGLGFSLTPYSSVGYRTQYDHPYAPNDPVWGNMGLVRYLYQGEGDVTEVKLGVGYEIFKNVHLGLAAQYYWGDINREYVAGASAIIPNGSTSVNSITGKDNYSISSIKGQIGLQWVAIANEKHGLTVGATFDFGGDLSPRRSSKVYVNNMEMATVRADTTDLDLVLPRQLTLGVAYQTPKWTVLMDYTFQNWGGSNSTKVKTGVSGTVDNLTSYEVAYTNTHSIKMGAEFTPSRYDARHFWKRWSYRAGLRYGQFNQTYNNQKLSEMSFTLGVGVPMTRRFLAISAIDVGLEFGMRGFNVEKHLGLIRQQYFKFSIGFTLFAGDGSGDYWFLRPKYD